MAGVINTGTIPAALWPGVKGWFGTEYDDYMAIVPKLFDEQSSNKSYEEVNEITSFQLAGEKAEGEAVMYDSQYKGYQTRYTNIAYALGYIVTREEIDDNLYMEVARSRSIALAKSMRETKEVVGHDIYNNAFTSFLSGDGAPLISATHGTISGNQSNLINVAADLSEASAEQLIIQMKKAIDTRNNRILLQSKSLVVPTELEFEAQRIFKSPLQNNTANNAINVLNFGQYMPDIVVSPYLTDADAWFIRSNVRDGMTLFNRSRLELTDDNDFDTDNAKFKAYERYSYGASDWRSLWGSPGV